MLLRCPEIIGMFLNPTHIYFSPTIDLYKIYFPRFVILIFLRYVAGGTEGKKINCVGGWMKRYVCKNKNI